METNCIATYVSRHHGACPRGAMISDYRVGDFKVGTATGATD
ncbi:MAG TPA: hypothetical protein VGQ81_17085 [Acidobacteriota bacterium]|nr:hypothetical protein [Acidobacteriota bacterium]